MNPYPEHSNDDILAENFANFFIGKIEKLRQGLNGDVVIPENNFPDDATLNTFNVATENEIRHLIMSSKSTHNSVTDPLPTWLLKEHISTMIPLITRIVNISLSTGTLHSSWKQAVVMPLLKKPGLDLIYKNYRPVSNLPFISKICEKAALKDLNSYADDNSLLPGFQSAYRTGFSTETTLLKLCNDILLAMDNQKVTALVSIDLSAAFDTIDSKVLLNILQNNFHVQGSCLDWFRSYLSERSQQVIINDSLSLHHELKYGVPQGSCAGPVLFTDYASTINTVMSHHEAKIMAYADDHTIYLSFKPNNELASIDSIQNCLTEIKNWMNNMKLVMNDSKSDIIIFGSSPQLRKLVSTTISVGSCDVSRSKVIKYLGAFLDENLTMSNLIIEKCKVATYNLYKIRKIRKYLTISSSKSLIQSLVISHIDYMNCLLYSIPEQTIVRLQKIQNMCVRTIFNLRKFDHITECMKQLHWLPIKFRIIYKILTLVFKCIHKSAPNYLCEMIIFNNNRYCTRSSGITLIVPRTSTRWGDRAFSVCGPRLWNNLPLGIRNIGSFSSFQKSIKTHLFREAYGVE